MSAVSMCAQCGKSSADGVGFSRAAMKRAKGKRNSRSGLSGVQCADSAVLVAQAPLPGPAVSTDRSVQRERNRETAAGAEGDRRASRRRGSQPGAAAGR
jgi:hypothetical protein